MAPPGPFLRAPGGHRGAPPLLYPPLGSINVTYMIELVMLVIAEYIFLVKGRGKPQKNKFFNGSVCKGGGIGYSGKKLLLNFFPTAIKLDLGGGAKALWHCH